MFKKTNLQTRMISVHVTVFAQTSSIQHFQLGLYQRPEIVVCRTSSYQVLDNDTVLLAYTMHSVFSLR